MTSNLIDAANEKKWWKWIWDLKILSTNLWSVFSKSELCFIFSSSGIRKRVDITQKAETLIQRKVYLYLLGHGSSDQQDLIINCISVHHHGWMWDERRDLGAASTRTPWAEPHAAFVVPGFAECSVQPGTNRWFLLWEDWLWFLLWSFQGEFPSSPHPPQNENIYFKLPFTTWPSLSIDFAFTVSEDHTCRFTAFVIRNYSLFFSYLNILDTTLNWILS